MCQIFSWKIILSTVISDIKPSVAQLHISKEDLCETFRQPEVQAAIDRGEEIRARVGRGSITITPLPKDLIPSSGQAVTDPTNVAGKKTYRS